MGRAMTVVALGVLVASAPARGDVVAAKTMHDFGTVEQGTPVDHQFALKNTGRQIVRIEGTQSSCGCTVAAVEGQLVNPGAITWVRVTLDTTPLAGRTTKTVTVYTSDARTPLVQLALAGVVLTDLTVTPTPVYLGRVYRGEAVRRELVVAPGRPGATTPYAVSAVESDSPALVTYVVAGDQPGQQKVIVELDVDAPPGRFTDHITIRTTSPRQPVITVPVFGHVLG
jgi:uncharacterized protein DUF1573